MLVVLWVQRSFFCDVFAITSWVPDVMNLVRPLCRDGALLSSPNSMW